jgi:hypothetical protein
MLSQISAVTCNFQLVALIRLSVRGTSLIKVSSQHKLSGLNNEQPTKQAALQHAAAAVRLSLATASHTMLLDVACTT